MDVEGIIDATLSAGVGRDAMIYVLAAIGLNVHFGYTGLLNFGQAGFMAVGAYGVAISVLEFGWSLWVGMGVGIGAAIVLALVLGLPTLRLRADYLAIVTIAASEIIRFMVRSVSLREVTGGSNGLSGFAGEFYDINPLPEAEYGIGFVSFASRQMWVLVVGWSLVALASLVVHLLIRSPWGTVLKAIREDEDAARALGKNVYWYKMQSLILGGVIGSLGGLMFAVDTQSVQPDSYSTPVTFFAYAALILGGPARVLGPVIGSMVFWMVLAFSDAFLREAVREEVIPEAILSGVQVGQVRFILVGLGLVLLMVFRPQGMIGDKNEVALSG